MPASPTFPRRSRRSSTAPTRRSITPSPTGATACRRGTRSSPPASSSPPRRPTRTLRCSSSRRGAEAHFRGARLASRRIDRGAGLRIDQRIALAAQRLVEAVGADLVSDPRHVLRRPLEALAPAGPLAAGVELALCQDLAGGVEEAD